MLPPRSSRLLAAADRDGDLRPRRTPCPGAGSLRHHASDACTPCANASDATERALGAPQRRAGGSQGLAGELRDDAPSRRRAQHDIRPDVSRCAPVPRVVAGAQVEVVAPAGKRCARDRRSPSPPRPSPRRAWSSGACPSGRRSRRRRIPGRRHRSTSSRSCCGSSASRWGGSCSPGRRSTAARCRAAAAVRRRRRRRRRIEERSGQHAVRVDTASCRRSCRRTPASGSTVRMSEYLI